MTVPLRPPKARHLNKCPPTLVWQTANEGLWPDGKDGDGKHSKDASQGSPLSRDPR